MSQTATARALPLPDAVDTRRIVWPYAITLAVYHALALLAVFPWFFTWTGVILALAGTYVFGTLGINLYYHRALTHRGLVCRPWFGRVLAVLAVCCMQDTPAHWVAVHRRHHEHADEQPDPHSPLVSFLWGHVGWMLVQNDDLARLDVYRYAKDVLRDPFLRSLEKAYPAIVLASWLAFFGAGFAAGLLSGQSAGEAARFGASLLVWGVMVRTVLVWHITWSVNSLSHLFGTRRYETGEDSRNNLFVALISNGEGWHNNHHADPRSARHGHRWWELDVTYLTIRALARLGLVERVIEPQARPAG
jgi:stearoyl-CoA desaturase (delta-9 desaturase)